MSTPRAPEPSDDRVASPPDAGHLGSFTTPDDVMTSPPLDADQPWPPLSGDSVRQGPQHITRTAILLSLLIVLVVALGLTGICQA